MIVSIHTTDLDIIDIDNASTCKINTKSNCLEVTKFDGNILHKWCYNLNSIRTYYIQRQSSTLLKN